MSAFLYSRFEAKREGSDKNESTKDEPPGLKTYADIFLGLVPAEALAVAVFMVDQYTDTRKTTAGEDIVVVTDPQWLERSFYGCIVLVVLLYIAGHIKHWDRWDFLRVLVPPAAFIGWSMSVRPSTMFNQVISISEGGKVYWIVFGGVALAAIAGALGIKADRKDEQAASTDPVPGATAVKAEP